MSISVPEQVKGIHHPHINEMYLCKEAGATPAMNKGVLVIETNAMDENSSDYDSYILDLLIDLNDLKSRVEEKVGAFDRIDIRKAH